MSLRSSYSETSRGSKSGGITQSGQQTVHKSYVRLGKVGKKTELAAPHTTLPGLWVRYSHGIPRPSHNPTPPQSLARATIIGSYSNLNKNLSRGTLQDYHPNTPLRTGAPLPPPELHLYPRADQ